MNTIFKVKDKELYFNITDAGFIGRYSAAYDKLRANYQGVSEEVTESNVSDSLLKQCGIFRTMLDEVWGEGTANRIFGDTYALNECIELMNQMGEFASRQEVEFDADVQQFARG